MFFDSSDSLRAGSARVPRASLAPSSLCALALSLVVLLALSSPVSAAFLQNYGTHNATDLMYQNVTESNGGASALFGAPSYSGNSIMFNPQNFLAQAIPGNGFEIVDSTIETILMANPGKVLNNIQIEEGGDYTLGGGPGGYASAAVGASFRVTILEIDNNPAPPLLSIAAQNLQVTSGAGPNGGEYYRPGDDGVAVDWDGSVFIDLDAFLASKSILGNVTKARLIWDNTLTAFADSISGAFIKKKDVNGVVVTTNIPEPTTCLLALMGLAPLGLLRRRRA